MKLKLKPENLKKIKKPAEWKIKARDFDIKDLDLNNNLIGQERAAEAIDFGLAVPAENCGYNIFIAGEPGSGRTSYALERLKELAASLKTPDDLLYVYNFEEPSQPVALNIPAGQGKKLVKDLENLLNELKSAIGKAFEQADYDAAKAKLVRDFQENADAIMSDLKAKAEQNSFALKRTPQGFMNIPLKKVRGKLKEIEPEEFEKLSAKRQKYYHDVSDKVTRETIAGLRVIRDMEKDLKEKLNNLEAEICKEAITPLFDEIKGEYNFNDKLINWLDSMSNDVIKNSGAFITAARDDSADVDFSRYSANLFVSNDPEKGVPVIRESNPTYSNIAGKIEYESHQNYLHTDFSHIIAGAIHKANGGFLLIDAEKVLMNYMSWEAIKRVLSTGESVIENLDEQYGFFHVASL
ncbi:MAG: AAA family ATPase, partial [Synergistaceae bacterium]|nr:AAA family ATPase [Synergistaceae bacterium]